MFQEQLDINVETTNVSFLLFVYKINTKLLIDLMIKIKSINFFKENIVEYFVISG